MKLFFSLLIQNFSIYSVKLSHSIFNVFFYLWQTRKLNIKNKKTKKKSIMVSDTETKWVYVSVSLFVSLIVSAYLLQKLCYPGPNKRQYLCY
jgi:hypothetical protein